jgi:hypothetical protein
VQAATARTNAGGVEAIQPGLEAREILCADPVRKVLRIGKWRYTGGA